MAYSGDSNYAASTGSTTLTVNNDAVALSYYVSALVSASYTVNASIAGSLINGTPRTGTLSLVEGSTTLASVNVATAPTNSAGQYALTVPSGSLAFGTNSLKVVYSGDSTYNAVSASLTLTGVSTLSTSIGLVSPTSLNLGQSLTVSAFINGTLASGLPRTGMLSLLEGSTTLTSISLATTSPGSNGYYALTLPAGLPLGTYNLSVAYSGDSNYASSSANLAPITVHIAGTSIGLSYTTPLVGQAFTLNAVINPTALAGVPHTGTLTLSDNGSALTSINLASATPTSSGYYASERTGRPASRDQRFERGLQRRCELRCRDRHDHIDGEQRRLEPGLQFNIVGRGELYGQCRDHGTLVGGASRTGTLSLVEGSTTLASVNVATAATNNSGQYALTVPGGSLVFGANSLKVVYTGDSNYTAASASLTVTGVSSFATSLGLSYATSLNLGQSLTINASVNGTLASGLPRTGTLSLM